MNKFFNDDFGMYTPRYAKRHWFRDKYQKPADKPDKVLRPVLATIPVGSSVWDIGAFGGHLCKSLNVRGYDARGMDGTPGCSKVSGGLVEEVNLAVPVNFEGRQRDWAVSIEVGEHIPPQYENNFCGNLVNCCTKGIFLTWATDGQRGIGHVNCHIPEKLVEIFSYGFNTILDERATMAARKLSSGHYARRILIFRHRDWSWS